MTNLIRYAASPAVRSRCLRRWRFAADDPVDSNRRGRHERESCNPATPAAPSACVQGGALTHASAFGMADLGRGKPLDTHAVFNLASVSKQFTAFALLLLEQQGKLKLDDPVVKYLPELSASAQGVTLAHLVHHTGGLRDYIEMLYMKGRGDADGTTIDEAVRLLGSPDRAEREAGRGVRLQQHRLLPARRRRRAGERAVARRVFAPADLRAARHEGHEHHRSLPGVDSRTCARLSPGRRRPLSSTRLAGNRSATARCTATSTISRSGTRISTPARSAAASWSRACTRSDC